MCPSDGEVVVPVGVGPPTTPGVARSCSAPRTVERLGRVKSFRAVPALTCHIGRPSARTTDGREAVAWVATTTRSWYRPIRPPARHGLRPPMELVR